MVPKRAKSSGFVAGPVQQSRFSRVTGHIA
jgi:hypothetical protein